MSRVAVVGEALLDVDVDGVSTRLAPDAPAPVVDDPVDNPRPGGAALAAAMAALDGHEVTLLTPLAEDPAADELRRLLPASVRVVALPAQGGTPVKRRIRVGGQTLVRLDTGGTSAPWAEVPETAREALTGVDVVLVSDYGRGLTTDPQVRALLADVATRTPVVWDPHPRGGDPVPRTWLFTPNEAEVAHLAARLEHPVEAGASISRLVQAANALVGALGTRAVAVTRGGRGALLSYGDGAPQAFAAESVAEGDPCAAGDRFAVTAALGIAAGTLIAESVRAAVGAATRHVAEGGAAGLGHRLRTVADAEQVERRAGKPPAPAPLRRTAPDAVELAERVRARGGVVVATGGCFDLLHAGHVASLEAARRLGDCLVVCLNSDGSVRRRKGPARPVVRAADRARVLLSLECVDAVTVFGEDTPSEVLRRVRPHIWTKGGDYAGQVLAEEAVLAEWDGQALFMPYLEGHSTTALLREARGNAAAASPVGSRSERDA